MLSSFILLTRQNLNCICTDHVIYTYSQDGLHIFCGRVRIKFAFNQLNFVYMFVCEVNTSGNLVKWKVAGNENKIIWNWIMVWHAAYRKAFTARAIVVIVVDVEYIHCGKYCICISWMKP